MAAGGGAINGAMLGRVKWSSSPVAFHRNKGKNVELTESNTVATRVRNHDCGVVFTSEPLVVGQMLKVTMTKREDRWPGGKVRAHLIWCVHILAVPVYYICHRILVSLERTRRTPL